MKQILLSICMMIKNEEKNLVRCLESLRPLREAISSELIIVDTGSTDDSVAIASRYTDKIYHHSWNDNFSAMRNITISYAKGKWIFIFDADEELVEYKSLVAFLQSNHNESISGAIMTGINVTGRDNENSPIPTPRVFRKTDTFRYEGSVHNQPKVEGNLLVIDATLRHYGYDLSDVELMERKFQRTTTLLKKELAKNPKQFYYRFQLAVSYSMHGDHELALQEIITSYEHYLAEYGELTKDFSYLLGTVVQFYTTCEKFGDEIVDAALRCLEVEPTYIDVWFFLAQAYARREEYKKSYEAYEQYLHLLNKFDELEIRYNPTISLYTLDKAAEVHFNMAILALKQKQHSSARMHLAVLVENYMRTEKEKESYYNLSIEIDFSEGHFIENSHFYSTLFEENPILVAKLLYKAEQCWVQASSVVQENYAVMMKEREDLYGLLNKMRTQHVTPQEFAESVLGMEQLNELPVYYAPALLGVLRSESLWESGGLLFNEETLREYIKYLDEYMHNIFIVEAKVYMEKQGQNESVLSYAKAKLTKNVCKYLLFSGELLEAEYKSIFNRYYLAGINFLQSVYSKYIIEASLNQEFKNVEEAFFFCILKSESSNDGKEKVSWLQRAAEVYPDMAQGVKLLLNNILGYYDEENMESLIRQLTVEIRTLIEHGNEAEAMKVVEEAEKIIGENSPRLLALLQEAYHPKIQIKKVLFIQSVPDIRTNKIAQILSDRSVKTDIMYLGMHPAEVYKGFKLPYVNVYQTKSLKETVRFINQSDYDVVFSCNEPDFLSALATTCSKPIVHDCHDMMSLRGDITNEQLVLEYIANSVCDGNVYVTNLVKNIAEKNFSLTQKPVMLLDNYVLKQQLPKKHLRKLSADDGEIHCVYEGGLSNIEGHHRNIENIFLQLTQSGIHVHYYTPFENIIYAEMAKKSPYLHWEGVREPNELIQEMTKYDIGLTLLQVTERNKGFLDTTFPNKAWEYLAAGLPILFSDLASFHSFLKKYAVGEILNSQQDIKEQVSRIKRIKIAENFLVENKLCMDDFAEALIAFLAKVKKQSDERSQFQ